jgi:hypothetical protein
MKNKNHHYWKASTLAGFILIPSMSELMKGQSFTLKTVPKATQGGTGVNKCCGLLSFATVCYGLGQKWDKNVVVWP